MRLLYICARIPFPIDDGGAVYIYNTTKHLSDLGHEVHLASFYSELQHQNPDGLTDICTLHYKNGGFTPYSVFSILKSSVSRKVVNVQHRMDRKIMKQIIDPLPSDFDVILLAGLHLGNFISLLRNKFQDTPIVLQHVNVEHELIKKYGNNEKNLVKKLIFYDQAHLMKKFETKILSAVDGISYISDVDAEKLYSITNADIPKIICPPGADVTSSFEFDEREENHLIAFSNWKWKPNIDGLFWFLDNVWPIILQNNKQVKLTLAGNDLPETVLKRFSTNISYVGFVEDLANFCRKATVQIVPLKNGSGVKLKMIEGMSYGNPIVCTKLASDGIDARNGVHYEVADSPFQFSNSVLDLLANKTKRRKYSTNSINLIKQKYSWDTQIGKLDQFLKSFI
tara:strand:- start:9386 stop:10573 length:1188 start_codon:yes stop_codon:yes gene_type:complete